MSQVQVRMYRPGGLGDCFLLSFPRDGGTAHVLIDCGVLKGTEDGKAGMQAIVRDVAETTGGLDVLVVTHEHWDHVSGFVQARDEFEKLPIREVWLAWTERPDDDLAKELREHKKKARKAVDAALQKLSPAALAGTETPLHLLSGLGQFFGIFGAAGRPSTGEAMRWVREHKKATVRWLCPEDEPLSIPGVNGVRVFVLGPPRDAKRIKQSDPSARTPEVYQLAAGVDLGFAAALEDGPAADSGHPFDASFETSVEEAKRDGEFGRFYKEHYFAADQWRQIELDWLYTAERLALQLDSDTNNTSLVLAFELIDSGRVLLFPGDAQVGNWLSWESHSWRVKDRKGELGQVTSRDLLGRTVLYKVGHHGSHNATLREKGLELMNSEELVAMLPVYEAQAHDQGRGGWAMPFGPLLDRLQEKTRGRVMRADNGVPAAWPITTRPECPENGNHIDFVIDL